MFYARDHDEIPHTNASAEKEWYSQDDYLTSQFLLNMNCMGEEQYGLYYLQPGRELVAPHSLSPLGRCGTSSSASSSSTYDSEWDDLITPETTLYCYPTSKELYQDVVPNDGVFDRSSPSSLPNLGQNQDIGSSMITSLLPPQYSHPLSSGDRQDSGMDSWIAQPSEAQLMWGTSCDPMHAGTWPTSQSSSSFQQSQPDICMCYCGQCSVSSQSAGNTYASLDPIQPQFPTQFALPSTSLTQIPAIASHVRAAALLPIHQPRPIRPIPLIQRKFEIDSWNNSSVLDEAPWHVEDSQSFSDSLADLSSGEFQPHLAEWTPYDEIEMGPSMCLGAGELGASSLLFQSVSDDVKRGRYEQCTSEEGSPMMNSQGVLVPSPSTVSDTPRTCFQSVPHRTVSMLQRSENAMIE